MITIGIDVGTTNTKVLALDVREGRTLGMESTATPSITDHDGDSHSASEVLATVEALLARLVRGLDTPEDIRAICAASVGEEVVLLDEGLHPVAGAIAWFDPRGQDQAHDFLSGAGRDLALLERWPPDPSFSLFKLLWIAQHRPDDLRRATSWIDLGGYVLLGLGGRQVMDWTHASRTGVFDLVARSWDARVIEAAGLAHLRFPELAPSGTVTGRLSRPVAERLGLRQDVAIVVGAHDHLCGAFATGVRAPGELFLSAGTSEAHLTLLRQPISRPAGRFRIEQGCYVDDVSYYAHIASPSGHVFQQWRRLLYGDADEPSMYAEVAASAAGAEGVTFVLLDDPRLERLDRLPYSAGRATVMRAVLEGLALRSAEIISVLEEAGGGAPLGVVVAGHATRVPFWTTLRASVLQRPLMITSEPESAALGASLLAARAVDPTSSVSLIRPREIRQPDPLLVIAPGVQRVPGERVDPGPITA